MAMDNPQEYAWRGVASEEQKKKKGLEGDLTTLKLGVSGGTRYLSSRSETYDDEIFRD